MSNINDALGAIKKASVEAVEASKPVNVAFGKVIAINPLKIQIEQKLILSTQQLILTRNVTNHNLSLTLNITTDNRELSLNNEHSHTLEEKTTSIANFTSDLTHNHNINGNKTITVNNALKINEEVILMRVQGGQKYIVLDRVGD